MTQNNQKPVHEIRLGTIRAAIWKNDANGYTRHNITLSRGYRDGEQWKDTQSFGRDDLPRVIKCIDAAYDWIFANQVADSGTGDTAEAQPQGDLPQGVY